MAVFVAPHPIHLAANLHKLLQLRVRAAASNEEREIEPASRCPFLNQFSKYHSTATLRAFHHLSSSTHPKDRSCTTKNTSSKEIIVVGLSFRTAPMELREKLSVPENDWPRLTKQIQSNCTHIEEAALLSTCNRTEVYSLTLSSYMGVFEVTLWMSEMSGIPAEQLRPHLYVLREDDAARHLMRVACGLESLVFGEAQIQSQVKQVLKTAQGGESGLGQVMSRLFKSAREAGKVAREKTSISVGAMSVSAAAAELAVLKLGILNRMRVVVIGAGKMARLLLKHLVAKGCYRVVVVNRSEQRVVELQQEFEQRLVLEYRRLEEMVVCVTEADVVFTCTASPEPLLFGSDLRQRATSSSSRQLYVFDIAVPRNVEACGVSGVQVYNVDDLEEVVAGNRERRKVEAGKVEAIIDEEFGRFKVWRESLEAVPTIKKLRAFAEKIREEETGRLYKKLGSNVEESSKKLIESMSTSLMNRYLQGPQSRLKCDADGPWQTVENRHAVERMFDL